MNTNDDGTSHDASSVPRPSGGSTDQWVEWLFQQRQQYPHKQLSQLLSADAVGTQLLLDLACVDLIEQLRRDKNVCAEDYVEQYPVLGEPSLKLDLIDAELCVFREIGKSISLDQLERRFPELEAEIRRLVGLEPGWLDTPTNKALDSSSHTSIKPLASATPERSDSRSLSQVRFGQPLTHHEDEPTIDSSVPSSDSPAGSDLDEQIAADSDGHVVGLDSIPVEPPNWFAGITCLSSRQTDWLYRGRDSASGDHLAMKVIKLPAVHDSADRKRILDMCEASSRVNHPSWILPRVAAIESQCLAIIRPWVFGMEDGGVLRRSVSPEEQVSIVSGRLRQLAVVAYALAVAHSSGSAHGAVHPGNLLFDHDGKLYLVDACSSRSGWLRWMASWESGEEDLLSIRQQGDVDDLMRMVSGEPMLIAMDGAGPWLNQMAILCSPSSSPSGFVDASTIGDELMRAADGIVDSGRLPRKTGHSRGKWYSRWFR